MKLFLNCFLLLSLSTVAPQSIINVDQDFESRDFGYAKNKIVLKFSDEILASLDQTLFDLGKIGISEIDYVSQLLNVRKIATQFPGAEDKYLNGRRISLASWHIFYFGEEIDVDSVLSIYSSLNEILEVQPVGIHPVIKSSNDTYRDDQWHLDQDNDADIDIENAWDIETGDEDIIVAILDTGVRYFHKDLGGSNASYANPGGADGNMWINLDDDGSNNSDDDLNGFEDDWIGWDFVTGITSSLFFQHVSGEDYDVADNDPRDFNGHGTHCAGIVAAINNNGYGVSSPAGGWNDGSQSPSGNGVKIMPLRMGYSIYYLLYGGVVGLVEMDFAAQAFRYAADNGARIASCSWGSSNSGGIADAIDYFIASGGLVFKAAGNDDNEDSDYILDRPDIIGVASTDDNDFKSEFSTYGSFVDISAPGSVIWSTYHVYDEPETDYIAALSGTSMATPLAASVAALIWSKNKNWSGEQVKNKLFDSADDIYSISENSAYIGKLGAGRINAYNALSIGSVELKVFLEGPFFSGSMENTLNTGGQIPLQSPYTEDEQSISEIPNNSVVDWVLVELRDKNDSDVIVEQKSALILNNGSIVDLDGVSLPQFSKNDDDYFVVIKHRNHLPVMSSATINLSN